MIRSLQSKRPLPEALLPSAAVLGALDDPIGWNRRVNATLEAMVPFQGRFVGFDPVRANLIGKGFNSPRHLAEGQDVGLPPHLFRDSFPDSRLGCVPTGRVAEKLGDTATTFVAAFTKQVESRGERIAANLQQSRTLATLRDRLRPKLLSGELSLAALDESVSLV